MRAKGWRLSSATGLFPCLALAGCATPSAPSLSLFGAYFPVWIACGAIGMLAAGVARILMVATELADAVPAQLLVCSAVGTIAACLLWLWLGQ